MKTLIRRTLTLLLAGAALGGALSGCVVYPERGYYHDGYYERHYWEH